MKERHVKFEISHAPKKKIIAKPTKLHKFVINLCLKKKNGMHETPIYKITNQQYKNTFTLLIQKLSSHQIKKYIPQLYLSLELKMI